MHSHSAYAVFGPLTLDSLNCFWQLTLPISKLSHKMLKYGHGCRWARTTNLIIISPVVYSSSYYRCTAELRGFLFILNNLLL